jgi:hypothetical protein
VLAAEHDHDALVLMVAVDRFASRGIARWWPAKGRIVKDRLPNQLPVFIRSEIKKM